MTMTDDTTPETTTEAVPVPVAAEPVPFWHRPHVERWLSPLLIPVLACIGVVIYVLNVSRIFLSAHGHTAVFVGSVMTVVILVGATIFANSKRLRSQTITLITAGFVLVVVSSGWIVLGHSQVKGGASEPLAASGPVNGTFDITALPSIKFAPDSLKMTTGVYGVTLIDASTGHTLDFDNPATLFPGLVVDTPGQKKAARIFFGEPGEYTFFCAIPGHRVTMHGTVTVTGDPVTLEEAEAKGKPFGTASAAGAPA